jgi:hypothetical protein
MHYILRQHDQLLHIFLKLLWYHLQHIPLQLFRQMLVVIHRPEGAGGKKMGSWWEAKSVINTTINGTSFCWRKINWEPTAYNHDMVGQNSLVT